MNHGTLSHNTQISLSRTATKFIFAWSYFLFFIDCSIKESKIQSSCYSPRFSSLVPKNLPCLTFRFRKKIEMLLYNDITFSALLSALDPKGTVDDNFALSPDIFDVFCFA